MLSQALESLTRQETAEQFAFEVLVIDDASTDNTYSVVKRAAALHKVAIRYILADGRGVAAARNRGIVESSGEWLGFFDDDQIAEPTWLKELFLFAKTSGAQIVGGARFLLLSKEELSAISPICRRVLGEINPKYLCGKSQQWVYLGTGNVLIRKDVIVTLGGFEVSHEFRGEDTEFLERARLAGFAAGITPKAVVHHEVPAYRLEERYMLWASLNDGIGFAFRDSRRWSISGLFLVSIARAGQAILINGPLYVYARLFGNKREMVGRKCLLYRAAGYMLKVLSLCMPRLFPVKRFLSMLQFRRERDIFKKQ